MSGDTTLTTSAFEDTPYDPNNPEAIADFWEGADIVEKGKIIGTARKPKQAVKIQITLPLSPEVVEHFRAMGKGWQSRIDEILREHVSSHSVRA